MTLLEQLCQALESGSYKQDCCMGVACDILDPNGWKVLNKGYAHILGSITMLGDESNCGGEGYLSQEGLKKIGLTTIDQRTLVDMNDRWASFGEIAAYIRTHILSRNTESQP